ncbi:hypothetical protein H6P81_000610 [Aristolochia fimbriata]|uniref:Uncharacterized protein n=1 Tax=Aristolochia fimbriata TaxID=158543 RepID=A0AAV7F7Z4_ARIFI|nr:hypothetical protein H6P81_000610 [Aristolochia fimbriata]
MVLIVQSKPVPAGSGLVLRHIRGGSGLWVTVCDTSKPWTPIALESLEASRKSQHLKGLKIFLLCCREIETRKIKEEKAGSKPLLGLQNQSGKETHGTVLKAIATNLNIPSISQTKVERLGDSSKRTMKNYFSHDRKADPD